MKFKKLVVIMLVSMVMLSSVACGAKNSEESQTTTQSNNEEVNAADENAFAVNGKDSYKIYPKSKEWDNYTIADRVMQVDDVMYVPGMSVSEALEKGKKSDVDYTYEYLDYKDEKFDENRIVERGDNLRIVVLRDGIDWFYMEAENCFDEDKPLSELPVSDLYLLGAAEDNSYVLNGITLEDIYDMDRDDVIALFDSANIAGLEFTEEEGAYWKDDERIECTSLNYVFRSDAPAAEWTGYHIESGIYYWFSIDPVSGKVADFGSNKSLNTRSYKL